MIRYIPAFFVAVFTFFSVALTPVRAALLDTSAKTLLQEHLGENVIFTRIYSKSPGDRSYNWHGEVDNQGRTFTLMEVTGAKKIRGGGTFAGPMIVGGYNPQSWSSHGSSHGRRSNSTDQEDRTAFLFNLTLGTFLDQKDDDKFGRYQTRNNHARGPYFGASSDLSARGNMNIGLVNPHSYGIEGGKHGTEMNILGTTGRWKFDVGQIETYAVSAAVSAVPLPPSAILFGTALFGMGAAGLRRNRKAAKKTA